MYILGFPYNEADMSQMVKNMPAMQEIWVQSLSWEEPLEKEMATYSNIFFFFEILDHLLQSSVT